MQRKEIYNCTARCYTFLMRRFHDPKFIFPGGAVALRTVTECIGTLEVRYGAVPHEMMVDYCVCQVYAFTGYTGGKRIRWSVGHGFGKKAVERFIDPSHKHYFEDLWLQRAGISRRQLHLRFEDRRLHPLYRFIYPRYEDGTKSRVADPVVKFIICQRSTLLWTPFSPVCRQCFNAGPCQQLTKERHPELYRIRVEEYTEGGNDGSV